ncbi:MAG: hypothetical protein BAJATHORv1_10279 [Candidatus Thorarchaeota archaeon]|nr:MAG: hypothetical protein BAJATHORv1_10279 [Candidatus Thorarchaeota archaeon]
MTDFEEVWTREAKFVNMALNEFLDMKIEQVRKLSKIHVQYYENVKEYIMRGGKRLRPVLVATGYKAIQKRLKEKHLYRAACSVEILHNGSLLHDDLIDHDETRRGGLTVHALYREWHKKEIDADEKRAADFGMTMAILGGDSLINLGAQAISESHMSPEITVRCLKLYEDAFQDLVDGVLLEMMMVYEDNPTPETYLEMIRMKTAVLFEKSLLIGAAIGMATDSQIDALSNFGIKVGQAFQIQDDILGTFGDEEVTGKPADGDIREGKKTMLVLESYRRVSNEQKAVLNSLLGKDDMTNDEVEQVRSIFKDSGALQAAKEKMESLLEEGQKSLDSADPPLRPKSKEFLLTLSNFLVQRSY